MMPSTAAHEETNGHRARPFPWRCAKCRQKEVYPTVIAYRGEVPYEGRLHTVLVPQLRVPRCANCGELAFGNEASDQISDALRRQLGLLTAEQIREGRATLGLSIPELAAHAGAPSVCARNLAEQSPKPSRAVSVKLGINADQRYTLHESLGHKESIKRVFVREW